MVLKKSNNGVTNNNPGTETVLCQRYKRDILNKLKLKVAHITF